MNSNFYFLLRREPLHSMVCMLSWWWAPWILWKDRGWKNSSEHCYFTSDENTFLIRICASQGLMRYSPLILINLIALLMVCSSSSLALIYWRKPSNDDKWAIILENVHHQRHIFSCAAKTSKDMVKSNNWQFNHILRPSFGRQDIFDQLNRFLRCFQIKCVSDEISALHHLCTLILFQ